MAKQPQPEPEPGSIEYHVRLQKELNKTDRLGRWTEGVALVWMLAILGGSLLFCLCVGGVIAWAFISS